MTDDRQRLHICLGTTCNNHCIFCMEDDRVARADRLANIDTATAVDIMTRATGRDEIMFTAGEPTLRPDLPKLIAHARSLGYAKVGLISNGRRFAYRPYLAGLLDRGLNYLVVSLHGPTAKIHDGLTRTPGSFDQCVAGLKHARELRQEGRRLRLASATVLNRRNLPVLGELLPFLQDFGPDEIVLNVIQPVGGGEQHFARLVPRATEVVAAVKAALAQPGAGFGNVRLLDLPRCATLSLPEEAVGFVESHAHFEPVADVLDGVATGSVDAGGDNGLVLVTKGELDDVLRVKGPRCRDCIYVMRCDGIWRRYADAHGFDEFQPVLEPRGS